MALLVTKVNSASTNVSFEYLGSEATWGYSISGTYTFTVADVSHVDGDDVLTEGIEALKNVYLNQNIVAKIGADEYVNGLVSSLNFPTDNHVDKTTATITLIERNRVVTAGALSDILDHVPSPQDVESFSESFSFSRGSNSYTRSREVSLKYFQDAGNNFLDKAKIFVKNMYLGSRPSFGYQEDGISENARFSENFKPIISETIDILNKEVKFTENLETNRISLDSGITYSEEKTSTTSLNEQGYTIKKYNMNIKALEEPLEINVASGVSLALDSLYSENTSSFGQPINIEKGINSDGGRASLSVTFTNDPSKNAFNNVTYSASKNQSEAFDNYTFDVNIISRAPTKKESFEAARDYWTGAHYLGFEKIPALFGEVISGDLNEVSRNTQFKPFERSISDKVVFSTDPIYEGSGDSILKKKIDITDNIGVDRHRLVAILGDSELLNKRGAGKNVSTRSVSVELVGKDFSSLEADALNLAEAEIPNGNYYYINSKESKHNLTDGISSASVSFLYFD